MITWRSSLEPWENSAVRFLLSSKHFFNDLWKKRKVKSKTRQKLVMWNNFELYFRSDFHQSVLDGSDREEVHLRGESRFMRNLCPLAEYLHHTFPAVLLHSDGSYVHVGHRQRSIHLHFRGTSSMNSCFAEPSSWFLMFYPVSDHVLGLSDHIPSCGSGSM